jgi:hypothetical protein
MADATNSALEAVLEAARGALLAKQVETVERADRIRAALDAYVGAVEAELAAEFAAKNGLSAPPPATTPLGAALALRAAVEGLPELRSRLTSQQPPARADDPQDDEALGGSQAATNAGSTGPQASPAPRGVVDARGGPGSLRYQSSEQDPQAAALIRDVQSLDLARMPLPLFRAWAEELAARARALQDRGDTLEDVPGRVIRKLTAIAYEKGVADIFGLNRKHAANWDEVADRARSRRELAVTGALQPLTQKIAIPEGLRAKVSMQQEEASPPTVSAPSADARQEDDEPESVRRLELPLLRGATGHGPVVLVGGVVKQEKVSLIASKFGIEVEWVDTTRHGTQVIGALEKRIRDRRLAAVVVLQGLIGHKHFEPIVSAARLVGLPFSYADKAGTGSVARAFLEIEKQLGEAAPDRPTLV